MMSRKLSALATALLATIASVAEAVSLGDLQMKSHPGLPLEATLEIRDVDMTISPLLVRVAPPATYVREGVTWPQEAQDLRMARLPGNTDNVKLRVTGAQSLVTSFPLLVELNAGGHVTVRQYNIQREANNYTVVADEERAARMRHTATEPVKAEEPQAATKPSEEKTDESAKALEAQPVKTQTEKPVEVSVGEKDRKGTALTTVSAQQASEATKPVEALPNSQTAVHQSVAEEGSSNARVSRNEETSASSSKVADKTAEKLITPAPMTPSGEEAQKVSAVSEEKLPTVAEKSAPEKRLDDTVESVAKTASTASMPAVATSTKKSLSVADLPKHLKSKLRAPTVVREYVALNGFNPEESFPVKRSMTLWSIGQLYWPSYPGALLEQVVVALRNKNPKAFQNGDPSKIIEGSMLASPDSNEVFSIDPLEAFRTIHGKKVAVPAPTQNLIDAQHLSRESAGEVAAAQITARMQGGNIDAQAVAGREALATWRSEHPDTEPAAIAEAPAVAQKSEAREEGEGREASVVTPISEKTLPPEETKGTSEAESSPTADEKAEGTPPGFIERVNALKNNSDAKKWGLGGLAALVLLLAGGLWARRRKSSVTEDKEPRGEQGVLLQRHIEPTTEAQLRAIDATIDEAVKNGTTAGAMGVGAMAYTQAQLTQDREENVAETTAEVSSNEATTDVTENEVANVTNASNAFEALESQEKEVVAEKTEATESPKNEHPDEEDLELGVPKDQPWLDPDDKELPPIDEEERQRDQACAAEDRRRVANTLKEVNLELGRGEKVEDNVPDYIPPLMSEPVDTDAPEAEVSEKVKEDANVSTGPRSEQKSSDSIEAVVAPTEKLGKATYAAQKSLDEGRAQQEALDAKLQLASSFIDLGACDEARELLEEVRKNGSERQRGNACRLLEKIAALKNAEK